MLKHKGGWEKAKAAKAKRKREAILEKTPSLLNYWNRPANITNSVDINSGSAGEGNSLAQDPRDSNSENRSVVVPAVACNSASSDIHCNDSNNSIDLTPTTSRLLQDSHETPSFSTDLREWDIKSPTLVDYWINKGPQECQNANCDFKESQRDLGCQRRYCTQSLFFYQESNSEVGNRDWLIYSPKCRKVYCFYCGLLDDSISRPALADGFDD